MSNRTLRKYDKEFKLNAVALYKTSDKSYPELSAELGVPSSTLAGWVKEHTGIDLDSFPGKGTIKQMEEIHIPDDSSLITRKVRPKESLKLKDLSISKPQVSDTPFILRKLNLKFNPGEHTLIKGASGLGKSSIFKVIAGIWKYGEGKISLPEGKTLYFLPQKPTIPHDTLRAILAFPQPIETYTDKEYLDALIKVKMNDFVEQLDEKKGWNAILSGGQKQLIAFARVLLKKPDWFFLDEATSSLDEDGEERVYQAVKELNSTTMVSIAHRNTVDKFHAKKMFFSFNQGKEVIVTEEAITSTI